LGLIIGWEALLELPLLFLLGFLRRKYPLYKLLIASGILFAITAFGQGISHSLVALLFFGMFFGFANSLNFSSGFNFVYTVAPTELRATAHALYTIAGSLGIIVGNLFAGVLIENVGIRPAYAIFATFTLLVSILYAISFVFAKYCLKKPLPDGCNQ
jgi:MFS family permease